MDAESPLFVLYTSGSTGKPKGVLHTTGGYLVYASMSHHYIFDVHDDDVYACVADIGWVTGHSYIIYGPLANGATTVMFESTPLYPDAGRYWQMVDDLGITIFYTAPTAIRAIAREGDEWVTKHSRKSLRILGTVGEPINPEIWKWYHDLVGAGRCAVVDTWWQTETGGIMITPLPGVTPLKPGSATLPFFGIEPEIVDEDGNTQEGNGVSGLLVMLRSWPGLARTIYGDHERFKEVYFSRFKGKYLIGTPAGHGRGRKRSGGPRGRSGSGGRWFSARDQGSRDLCLRQSDTGLRGQGSGGALRHLEAAGAPRDWPDCGTRSHPDRGGPAQDSLRQDHAADLAQDRNRRGRGSGG
jgi:acetyl-CoA synthetase